MSSAHHGSDANADPRDVAQDVASSEDLEKIGAALKRAEECLRALFQDAEKLPSRIRAIVGGWEHGVDYLTFLKWFPNENDAELRMTCKCG